MVERMSDANLMMALIGSRGSEWHPCVIDIRPDLPHLRLGGPTLVWVPKTWALNIDQVANCIDKDLRIPVQAQTLAYYHDTPSRMYGVHRSTCTCNCHGRKRTNLATDKISKFILKVDVSKMVNKSADACFRNWVQNGTCTQKSPSTVPKKARMTP